VRPTTLAYPSSRCASHRVGRFASGVRLVIVWAAAIGAPDQTAAGAQSDTGRQVHYFNRQWEFNDVHIETLTRWLARAGVEVPIALEGRISGALSIGVPWGGLRDARAWRFGGRLTSPRFLVDDIPLENVAARLNYRDGSLFLDELRLNLPPRAGEVDGGAGLVSGAADMELIPRGQFTATLTVDGLSAGTALARIPALESVRGLFSGRFKASAAVDRLTDLAAWRISGTTEVRQFRFQGLPPANASVQLLMEQGLVVARDFELHLEENVISGGASLALRTPYAWAADARVTAPDVPAVLALIEKLAPSEAIASSRTAVQGGALESDLALRGTLGPLTGRASGTARLLQLRVTPPAEVLERAPLKPVTVDELTLQFETDGSGVRISQLAARLGGGELAGAATLPTANGAVVVRLSWSDINVADIVAAEPLEGGSTSGRIDLTARRDQLASLSGWQADLNASLSEANYSGVNITNLQTGDVRLREGRVIADDLRFIVNGNAAAISLNLETAEPYSLAASFNIPGVDLRTVATIPQLASIGQQLAGQVNASGSVSGTLQPLALEGQGQGAGQAIVYGAYRFASIRADWSFDRDLFNVNNLNVQAYGGFANGSAAVPLSTTAAGDIRLSWSGIDLTAALRDVSLDPIVIQGATAGSIVVSIPPGTLQQWEQWSATASLELPLLRVYDFDFEQLAAPTIELRDGTLTAPGIAAVMDGQPVQARLTFDVQAPWSLVVDVKATRFQAQRLAGLPYLEALAGRLSGLADTESRVTLAFSPFDFDVGGMLVVDAVGFDQLEIERLSGRYRVRAASLTLTDVAASLYGGSLSGNAAIPFDDALPGSARVIWNDVEVGQVITETLRPPTPLAGTTSGHASVNMPAGQLANPVAWGVDAQVELPDMRARRRPVASVTATLSQRDGRLHYSADGMVVEGCLTLEGNRPAELPASGFAALGRARLALRGASIGVVRELIAAPDSTGPAVDGRFDIQLNSQSTPQSWAWTSSVSTSSITLGDLVLTPGIQVRAAGNEAGITLQQASGRFAGGDLAGAGQWGFGEKQPRAFQVRLRRASLEQLQALAWSDTDAVATGNVDLDLRVRPGAVWRIQATTFASRAIVGGLALRNVGVPLDIAWSPLTGQASVSTTSAQLSLAGGRLTGRLTARRTTGWNANGNFRFYRVDAAALSGFSYASGRLTGTLELVARNARSINDVQATLLADLEGAQGRGVPVIDQIANTVPGAGFSGATTFGEGRLEARLTRGVVRLDRLSLANKRLQLYITGIVSLSGRLNLEATAATGKAVNPTIANALLAGLVATPAAPVALLLRANDFLSDRVVHLAIRGTLSRPTIRLRPFQMLEEEAVRFFLRQATGGVAGGVASAP
jgi:hypothetical protein